MEKGLYPKEIQVFFNEVILKIRSVLDPDFIILAGSFGKESWLYSDGILLSDFEFVFVCEKRWSLKKKKLLLKKLNIDYPYDINLKGYLKQNINKKIISNYSFKNPGYISLDFFDTFNDPKFIFTKNDMVLDIDCLVEEIPIWEAWRLYVNRMGDLLRLGSVVNNDRNNIDYIYLKVLESTADSYCIINGIYEKNISKRIDLFNQELVDNDQELSQNCKESFPFIQKALIARRDHDLSGFNDHLSAEELKIIVNSWMDYFEEKLTDQEGIGAHSRKDFYNNYLSTNGLQNKYLGFNYKFNKLASNGIRFIYHPFLVNTNFKWYSNNSSWRHVILLSVSSTFRFENNNDENQETTKSLMSHIIKKKHMSHLSNKEVVKLVLEYWKILR